MVINTTALTIKQLEAMIHNYRRTRKRAGGHDAGCLYGVGSGREQGSLVREGIDASHFARLGVCRTAEIRSGSSS